MSTRKSSTDPEKPAVSSLVSLHTPDALRLQVHLDTEEIGSSDVADRASIASHSAWKANHGEEEQREHTNALRREHARCASSCCSSPLLRALALLLAACYRRE